ncbi:hypothetical protein JFQ93_001452 [Aeromonas sobria]|nr:hypothetical protein [Aeromonas sobria]
MFDHFYKINYLEHNLYFNGTTLIDANYEPDWGVYIDVEFNDDYFVSGDSRDVIYVTSKYRGLRGTHGYQVDLFIADEYVKTMMVQTTPNGNIFKEKER